ncbi:hypothetical protein CsSME_00016307 [Camellia sinensis var. sinensis]
MEGRVVIRSDSFACDGHCSVRSMKTHKQSRRSHLTSPSGRSSRTSSLHRPISGFRGFQFHRSLSIGLSPSLSISVSLYRSRPQITGFSLFWSFSLSVDLGHKSQHLSHMEALWRSFDAKIDKAQPAIKIRLEFWGE